jgi:hypothetical protein
MEDVGDKRQIIDIAAEILTWYLRNVSSQRKNIKLVCLYMYCDVYILQYHHISTC